MTTEAQVRERALALFTAHPDLEYRPRELPALLEVDVEPKALQDILAPDVAAGAIECRRAGRGVFYSAPAQDAEVSAQPVPFNAAAWTDGDVDLYGGIELEDGGIRLTAPMVAKLKRLITWMPA